jgi:ribonuclease III
MESTELSTTMQEEQREMAKKGLRLQLSEQLAEKGLSGWVYPLKVDESWLFQALTHSSFLNESSIDVKSYERLEFLGDALLGQIVSKELFHYYPEASEGDLSQLKASLVSAAKWAEFTDIWGLSELCLHGRGLTSMTMLIKADLFEAFCAFIYFNRGQEALEDFFMQTLERGGGRAAYFAPLSSSSLNPRGDLQELCWQLWKTHPEFAVEEKVAEDGQTLFFMTLTCGEAITEDARQIVVSGEFKSKREGQKALSQLALEELNKLQLA